MKLNSLKLSICSPHSETGGCISGGSNCLLAVHRGAIVSSLSSFLALAALWSQQTGGRKWQVQDNSVVT